jgi:hypothetical protein
MGVMTDDERMNELMGRALREIDPVPEPPREAMWARIQALRAEDAPAHDALGADGTQRDADGTGDVIELRPRVRRTWIPWSAAVAATLVLGIGLGRISMQGDAGSSAQPVAVDESADVVPPAYRLAATNHLQRTETLLASLAVDDRPGGAREMSSWARELLTDTRLLLSSPAAEDVATRRLLEDLELVLAQIAGIPEARAEEEVELIHDGINQSDVLLRLRAATAGPRLVGT